MNRRGDTLEFPRRSPRTPRATASTLEGGTRERTPNGGALRKRNAEFEGAHRVDSKHKRESSRGHADIQGTNYIAGIHGPCTRESGAPQEPTRAILTETLCLSTAETHGDPAGQRTCQNGPSCERTKEHTNTAITPRTRTHQENIRAARHSERLQKANISHRASTIRTRRRMWKEISGSRGFLYALVFLLPHQHLSHSVAR